LFMSIKHQVGFDLNRVEMIIVNDCGPVELKPEDLEYMKLPFKVRFLKTDKNSGPGVARSVGIRNVETDWFVCIDADDLFTQDAFTMFLNTIEQRPNLKWVNFSGKVVGIENQRTIIQDHKSELVWSFGHFINID